MRSGGRLEATPIDLVSLHIALQVNELGSIRCAAEVLGSPASVVSRRIRALEDTLPVSLFDGSARGVEPTIAGHRLRSAARSIIVDSEHTVRSALALDIDRMGSLRGAGRSHRRGTSVSASRRVQPDSCKYRQRPYGRPTWVQT
ncbi:MULTISPECIES: LysR family transcriptional regulator [Methylobacterium]|uniref:LysR family transcriptional regulator n=1 Tax=Methylobacterium komagatae TaxID=374425 RepID=A0ABW2BH17_9HYPH|nr:LysR family transcriptional regulator [Methylobacterium brachiatum]